jgi:predicted amidophosphoribosyltransferase
MQKKKRDFFVCTLEASFSFNLTIACPKGQRDASTFTMQPLALCPLCVRALDGTACNGSFCSSIVVC